MHKNKSNLILNTKHLRICVKELQTHYGYTSIHETGGEILCKV